MSEGATGESAPAPVPSRRRPNYGRRIAWLGGFVVVLLLAYTAGWFWLAGEIEDRTRAALAELNRDGVAVDCANPTARGFPFRIGLYCDAVAFTDERQGVSVSAGAFRSAGQIYDPLRLVAELDGPASLDLPEGEPLSLAWDQLRASVRLAAPLPSRLSVEGRDLGVALPTGLLLASAKRFEAHARPNGDDLDLAATVDGVQLGKGLADGRTLPLLDARYDLTLAGGVALLTGPEASLRGHSLVVRTLTLASGAARVELAGTATVGEDGLLDGQLAMKLVQPKTLATLAADAFPENRAAILAAFSGVEALGPEPSMPLTVVDGKASFGFIPLGTIPPLD